jgi:hypothetical protein
MRDADPRRTLMPFRTALVAALLALMVLPRAVAGQLADRVPPEPAHGADLAALGAWIERWLPIVGAVSYQMVGGGGTSDFFAHASDSVTSALLDGCTLVLRERLVSIVGGTRSERDQAVRVPLEQVDTAAVQPKVRRAQMLLTSPNVMVRGQLVVPLRNRSRTGFIIIRRDDERGRDSLAAEHLIPLIFAEVAASRSARAIRQAAAACAFRRAPEPAVPAPALGTNLPVFPASPFPEPAPGRATH